ncbi:MAG: hypothetical protein WC506_01630 [Candidatus Micrarchaeia archaeon]
MDAKPALGAMIALVFILPAAIIASNSSIAWEARQDALSQAASIVGTGQNLYNVPVKGITASNPTGFFFARLVAMHPSVNGAISSREGTGILWSWGESHSPNYTITSPADHPDCPPTRSVFTETGQDRDFIFTFNFTNGNSSIAKSVSAGWSQNPLPLPFTTEELDSIMPNAQARQTPWIETSLNATIIYHYKVKVYYYDRECVGGGAAGEPMGCGCNSKFRQYNADFTLHDNDSMITCVENGEPSMAFVRPAGYEQSEGNNSILIAMFSSRKVSVAKASIDGEAAELPLSDYYRENATGFSWVAAANFTGNAFSTAGAFPFSQNKSEAYGDFSAVANSSGIVAYEYEYALQTQDIGLGRHELELEVYDMLGANDAYRTYFYKKAGTRLSLACAGGRAIANITNAHGAALDSALILVSSPEGNYSCASGQDGTCSVDLEEAGSAASAAFNGDDRYFGSYAQCPGTAQGTGGWAYGIAAACLAIGGIGLIAKYGWRKR